MSRLRSHGHGNKDSLVPNDPSSCVCEQLASTSSTNSRVNLFQVRRREATVLIRMIALFLSSHTTHMCNTHTLTFPPLSCPLSPPARSIFAQHASRARTQSHCRRFLGSGRRFARRRRRRRRRRRQALLIAARSVGSHVSQSTAMWRRRVSICFNAKWPAARLY